jgi:uncharacterized Zn-binding protein involved in type VI secretion
MFEKTKGLGRRRWLGCFTIVMIGIAGVALGQTNGPKDDITGTVSQAEPTTTQDGTPAHPYADANQCPPRTDLVFWPSGRSVPTIPPGFSVCFVGSQPFEASGPDLEVRGR